MQFLSLIHEGSVWSFIDIRGHLFLITAQQEAQRAQFLVEKAIQERQQKIVQAEGEAKAAILISFFR